MAAQYVSSTGILGCTVKVHNNRILLYHSITSHLASGIYEIESSMFYNQMKILQNSKKKVVELADWPDNNQNVVITFDDGYIDTLTLAAPILSDFGFNFTVFVSPELISSSNKYLNKVELLELASNEYCNIGAHGYSHCDLTICNEKKLRNEIHDSKSWLEDLLSTSICTMSYPYGMVNDNVKNEVVAAGYKIAVTSNFGSNKLGDDSLSLKRTDVWSFDNIDDFDSKLHGHWDWIKYIL